MLIFFGENFSPPTWSPARGGEPAGAAKAALDPLANGAAPEAAVKDGPTVLSILRSILFSFSGFTGSDFSYRRTSLLRQSQYSFDGLPKYPLFAKKRPPYQTPRTCRN